MDGDVDVEDSHSDKPHIGHSRVASILVLGGDSEGCQALGVDPWAAGCRQHVVTGALEVKVPAIEGMVVGVAPQPARGLIVGHAHTMATLLLARLLWPTRHTMAQFWRQVREDLEGLPGMRLAAPQHLLPSVQDTDSGDRGMGPEACGTPTQQWAFSCSPAPACTTSRPSSGLQSHLSMRPASQPWVGPLPVPSLPWCSALALEAGAVSAVCSLVSILITSKEFLLSNFPYSSCCMVSVS